MNIVKIILGIILLVVVPSHWFFAGIEFTSLFGFPGIIYLLFWGILLLGGISLIIQGLTSK
jgi:hypothetical protein